MIKNILKTLLFMLFISCNNINHTNNGIKIEPSNDTLKLSDLYSSGEVIKLTGISLNKISKIVTLDSLMIVLGQAFNGDLHLFNNQGKYKSTIFNKYNNTFGINDIQDFDVFENQIYFLADYGRQIFTYDIHNQKYSHIANTPNELIAAEKFLVMDSNKMLLYNDTWNTPHEEYKLYKYNYKKDSIEKRFLPIDKEIADIISISQKNDIYKVDSSFYLYETFSNHITGIHGDSTRNKLAFNYGEYAFPSKYFKTKIKTINELVDLCKQKDYIWGHINLFENGKYIISSYSLKNDTYINVINKYTTKSKSYRYVYDNICSNNVYAATDFSLALLNNNESVFLVEPYIYIDASATNKNEKNALDIKYTDNTMLFLLKQTP